MSITSLPRVIPAAPGKPVRAEAASTQELMSSLRRDPSVWTPNLAAAMAQGWDQMAANWNEERGDYRPAPLRDALDRGGPFPVGPCLELCCGTGILTSLLESQWPEVVSVDLSAGMLGRATSHRKAQVDASAVPLGSGSCAAVVICDGPLFAREVVRVLAPDGVLVWSNALAEGSPYYVSTSDLLDALGDADGASSYEAVDSEAAWGRWVVARRSKAA